VLPVLWCAAEWLPAQPWLWGGVAMPLGAIGYSQADLPTLGLAALSSVTAVSAAVLAVNALLLIACSGRSPTVRLAAVTGLMTVATVVAVVSQEDETPRDAASGHPAGAGALIHLVQPNLPDSAYLAAAELPAAHRALIERLAALTMAEHHDDEAPTLTIMPEAAWPGPISLDAPDAPTTTLPLAALGLPRPLLFGAPSTDADTGTDTSVIPR